MIEWIKWIFYKLRSYLYTGLGLLIRLKPYLYIGLGFLILFVWFKLPDVIGPHDAHIAATVVIFFSMLAIGKLSSDCKSYRKDVNALKDRLWAYEHYYGIDEEDEELQEEILEKWRAHISKYREPYL